MGIIKEGGTIRTFPQYLSFTVRYNTFAMKSTYGAVVLSAAVEISSNFAAPAAEDLVVREPESLEERDSHTNYILSET